METAQQTPEQLFFLLDKQLGMKTVYSGHKGTGRNFEFYQSDYGKYAMKPLTRAKCEELKKKIEKAAGVHYTADWRIIPMTDIKLCNFNTTEEHDAYYALQEEQKKHYPVKLQKYVRLLSYDNACKVIEYVNKNKENYANITPGGISINALETSWTDIEEFVISLDTRYEINWEAPHKTNARIIEQLKATDQIEK